MFFGTNTDFWASLVLFRTVDFNFGDADFFLGDVDFLDRDGDADFFLGDADFF